MSEPALTADLAYHCDSDVADTPWMGKAWDLASSDSISWLDPVIRYKIAGTLTVNGKPAKREIIVLGADEAAGYQVLGDATSATSGNFEISWSDYGGAVIPIYLDDFGSMWQPTQPRVVGDIVYPTHWNGWQFECITAGVTGSSEPVWWYEDGHTGLSGTATFKARQYLPALADGPILPYQLSE